MKLSYKKSLILPLVVSLFLELVIFPCYAGTITDGYPGYPGVWTGLTTNTLTVVDLDSPVAMVGSQPDMSYCVKKVTFSGFDFVFTNVTCDAAASDDRNSVKLFPQGLLDTSSQYAYNIVNINFQGGGSAQNFNKCYFTGTNPTIPLAFQLNEADMCTDYNYPPFNLISGGNYCFKCHVGGYTKVGTWDSNNYPVPTCTE
jgi:hypothetical protein